MANLETIAALAVALPDDAHVHVWHCLEPQNGENDNARVNGSKRVAHAHQDHVPHAVVVRSIVAAKCDQGTECQSEAIEDLGRRVKPDRGLQQFLDLERKK